MIYILGISEDTRNHFSQIYDIKSGYIKTECLHQGWQTSGSVRVVRLAFNLYTGGTPSIDDYSRGDICPPEIRDKRLDIRDKSIENRECDNDAHAYGKYGNVFLAEREMSELQNEFSDSVLQDYVERLSEYMESTGREYKSHAATIRRWANADRKGAAPPARNRDYTVKEGDTI